jgi:hypothetical protein
VDEEKTKMCRFGSGNWFWLSIIAEFAVAGEWHSSAVHLRKKSVINMIRLLLSVSNWSIIMIGAGGLLLVVPPPICCPSCRFRGGVAQQQITELGCGK